MKLRVVLTVLFMLSMIFVGLLRLSAYEPSAFSAFARYATAIYVLLTVFFAFALIRAGAKFRRVGFWRRPRLSDFVLAGIGVLVLQVSADFLAPLWENLFGTGRALDRFSDLQGSVGRLAATLAFSWTFAAVGEEIAFRVVMMRSIASSLGDGAIASTVAVVLQAVIFGLVHMYQGPTGVAGAAVSGLVFGVLLLGARGAIWPAVLAHGLTNTIGLVAIYQGG